MISTSCVIRVILYPRISDSALEPFFCTSTTSVARFWKRLDYPITTILVEAGKCTLWTLFGLMDKILSFVSPSSPMYTKLRFGKCRMFVNSILLLFLRFPLLELRIENKDNNLCERARNLYFLLVLSTWNSNWGKSKIYSRPSSSCRLEFESKVGVIISAQFVLQRTRVPGRMPVSLYYLYIHPIQAQSCFFISDYCIKEITYWNLVVTLKCFHFSHDNTILSHWTLITVISITIFYKYSKFHQIPFIIRLVICG